MKGFTVIRWLIDTITCLLVLLLSLSCFGAGWKVATGGDATLGLLMAFGGLAGAGLSLWMARSVGGGE